jgi:hypothetical protein
VNLSPGTIALLKQALRACADRPIDTFTTDDGGVVEEWVLQQDIRIAELELQLAEAEARQLKRKPGARAPARRSRMRYPVRMPDPHGCDRPPDPSGAVTAREFMDAVRAFREWVGNPSYRAMAASPGSMAAYSTLHAVLHSDSLPGLGLVVSVIYGCGGRESDVARFIAAWHRLTMQPGPPRLTVAS